MYPGIAETLNTRDEGETPPAAERRERRLARRWLRNHATCSIW